MATPRRRKTSRVIDKLIAKPERFEFIQAVRLLEQFASQEFQQGKAVAGEPIAQNVPPNREAIRFRSSHSLQFQPTELVALQQRGIADGAQEKKQWELTVGFIGLLGSHGVLPYHYSEAIVQRLRLKDEAMLDFFDLFNHRVISLFYQASQKYSLPINYERHQQERKPLNEWDLFTQTIRSFTGLGTKYMDDRLSIYDDPLLFYGAHFGQQVRNADNLGQMLSGHFDIKATIEQFVGQWQELQVDFQTRLPGFLNPGVNNCLGRNVVLGDKCWQIQSKFSVRLNIKDYETFMTFSPNSQKVKAMQHMIRLYVGLELDFDIVIKIPAKILPPTQLLKSGLDQPIMGWNTHLGTKTKEQVDDRLIDIRIPCHESLVA